MTTLAAQPAVVQNHGGMYKQLETMGTHKQVEAAKNVYVYLNGDRHFVGRKFVVNKKHIGNFDGFLNQVSACCPVISLSFPSSLITFDSKHFIKRVFAFGTLSGYLPSSSSADSVKSDPG